MSSDSAKCTDIVSGKVASRGPSENTKIVAVGRTNAMVNLVLLLMKVSSIHRDSIANVCLRIQRGQYERTI